MKIKRLSGLGKIRGLIGLKKPYPVFFNTRFGIHTFGLNLPIDILILNNKNKVVIVKKNLLPNRVFFWNPKYFNVIELPAGKYKFKLGQKINVLCID